MLNIKFAQLLLKCVLEQFVNMAQQGPVVGSCQRGSQQSALYKVGNLGSSETVAT
jgi:hypothetical protein